MGMGSHRQETRRHTSALRSLCRRRRQWIVSSTFLRIATSGLQKSIVMDRDRNGGYTRIMRCGYRDGDKAPMCYIEYIDRW